MTRGAVVGCLVIVIAALGGASSLSDNSFLTHLATGRLILDGHLPTTDPYSFTAPGHPWVVQSWFASLLYGIGDRIGSGVGIRLLVSLSSATLGALLWRLTRPARALVGRLCAVAPAIVIGMVIWGERPLLFGLVGFALVLVVLQEEKDPRWLVPVMWVWVNTHGSFPLGIALVVAYGLGVRLDHATIAHPVRTLEWMLIGTLVGGINPLGPKLLWFPLELLSKQDVLRHMVEWQAPSFTTTWERIYLLMFVIAMGLATRLPRDRAFRLLVPALLFGALAFTASRNVALATIVLTPLIAAGLGDLGNLSSGVRSRTHTILAGLLVVAGFALVGSRLAGPSFDLSTYPTEAFDWLAGRGDLKPTSHIVTRDTDGNYLGFRTGGAVPVFVDDRVDMFPRAVIDDELTLISGLPKWEEVLDRWRIDTVVWNPDSPLASLLSESRSWQHMKTFRSVESGDRWAVYRRIKPADG